MPGVVGENKGLFSYAGSHIISVSHIFCPVNAHEIVPVNTIIDTANGVKYN
jgi:hypothetical protein